MTVADEVGSVGDAEGAGSMLNEAAIGDSIHVVPGVTVRRDEGLMR